MFQATTLVIVATLCLTPVVVQSAFAGVPVYGTPVTGSDLTAGRSFEGFAIAGTTQGLEMTDGTLPTSWEDATLKWEISFNGGTNLWEYTYWLEGFDMGAVSHFTLDVSNDLECNTEVPPQFDNPLAVINPMLMVDNLAPVVAAIECGEFDMLDRSLKFDIGDDGDLHYSFESNRPPVWHHAAIVDGSQSPPTPPIILLAHNSGFNEAGSDDKNLFIAAPNSAPMVGGEFIGIDSTALLVTGAQTNAAWMIPVIVSAIGIGIVIARKF